MRHVPSILALLTVVGVLVAGVVVGDTHYEITVDQHVDTPPREVTHEGRTYEIRSIGRVDPGETASVSVGGPSDSSYTVDLKDADGRTMDSAEGDGDDTLTFDTDGYEPGTYVFVLYDSDGYQTVTPLVVSGYHASVDAPDTAEVESEVTVETSVTTVDDAKAIDGVEVVIGNEDDQRRVALAADGDGEYGGTFSLDTLPEGDYSMYVVVQGTEEVLDAKEILGVSDARSFSIESASTGSDSPSGDGSSGDSSNDETTDDSPDDGSSGAGDGSSNDGSDGSPSGDGTTTDTPSTVTSTATSTTDATTTADENVITPATSSPETTTETGGQSLGFLPAVVALLSVGFAAYRRR